MVLCFIFLLIYTVPSVYHSALTTCQEFSSLIPTCGVYMALFNINIADMVILAVFSIVF